MAQWWVQTRSKAADYRFLGDGSEPTRWWAPYLRFSAPEDKMLLVETDPGGWRAYCTGMGTGRRDGASPPRDIRASVLVQGTPDESELLAQVVSGWFRGTLERSLTEIVTGDVVDAWMSGGGPGADVSEGVLRALAAGVVVDAAIPTTNRRAVGPSKDPMVRAKLVATARWAASQGVNGTLCWLNLLAKPGDALQIPAVAAAERVVILVDEEVDEEVARPPEAADPPRPKSKPALGREGPSRRPPRLTPTNVALLVGAAVLIVLVVCGRR